MLLFWPLATVSFYLRSSAASTLMSSFSNFNFLALFVAGSFFAGSQLAVDEAADNVAVAVDATVPQERPVAPDALQMGKIALDDQNLLPIFRSFAQDDTEGITNERTAPELQSSV